MLMERVTSEANDLNVDSPFGHHKVLMMALRTTIEISISLMIKSPQEEHCAPNVKEASEHDTLKPPKLDHLNDDL